MPDQQVPSDMADAQEAYQAYKAYKQYKAQQQPAQAQPASAPSEYAVAKGLPPDDSNNLPNVVGDPVDRLKTTAKVGTGIALGLGGMALTGGLEGLGGLAARTAVNGGAAGLQKYLSNRIDQNPNPSEGVVGNAALGGALSLGFDALSGLLGGAKRLYNTVQGARNADDLQDTAQAAIRDATARLKESEAQNVQQQLGGKTLGIDTTRIRGINPEIDSTLGKYATPYGDIPSEASVDAQDANKIRQLIDSEISYKKLGPFAQTAESAERDNQLRGLADNLRGQIHGISPDLSDTFDQWSDNLNQARALDKSADTAPLSAISGPNFDRYALLQKVDNETGSNLGQLGSQINDSRVMWDAVHNPRVFKMIDAVGSPLIKGAYNGATQGSTFSNPAVLQSLFGAANSSGGQ